MCVYIYTFRLRVYETHDNMTREHEAPDALHEPRQFQHRFPHYPLYCIGSGFPLTKGYSMIVMLGFNRGLGFSDIVRPK